MNLKEKIKITYEIDFNHLYWEQNDGPQSEDPLSSFRCAFFARVKQEVYFITSLSTFFILKYC